MTWASEVFPVPGGPYRMMELIRSALIARQSNLPFPKICFCPSKSSNVLGRIRAARGTEEEILSDGLEYCSEN